MGVVRAEPAALGWVEEALANAKDALAAVIELYEDGGRVLPASVQQDERAGPLWLETLIQAVA